MTGTSYLVLLLGLFLSCFSLPTDIKNKTIHTIATKPVRSTEIILGRILGFTAVGTMLLVAMGLLSYVFVAAVSIIVMRSLKLPLMALARLLTMPAMNTPLR